MQILSHRYQAGILELLLACLLILSLPAMSFAGKKEARALLEANRGAEAYAAYMELWRESPSDDEILLGLARSAMLAGQHTRALLAYETLTRLNPDNAELHRELAATYRALGNEEAAQIEEDAARAAESSSSRDGLLSVHGQLAAGALYDSNISLGPDSRDITVEGISFRLTPEDDAESAWGTYLSGSLDIRRRLGETSPWTLLADVQASQTAHIGEPRGITWGRIAAGMGYDRSKLGVTVRAKGEELLSDLDDTAAGVGLEANLVYRLSPMVHLVSRGEISSRHYHNFSDRQGTYAWLGEYVRLHLDNDTYRLEVGGRVIRNNAESARYDSDAWELSARLRMLLPRDCQGDLFVTYGRELFEEPSLPAFSTDRRDNRLRAGLVLAHNLTEALSVEARYEYSRINSNTDLFDYERNIVSTGVAWNF